jgi:signal-transduction protein with cAMP-binding, CBS, and nucleotidyltransferase domain/PAS domain-containing protein
MTTKNISINRRQFFLRIILPSVLTIALFVVFNFGFIIPYFEVNQTNNKKQMIREIVYASICIADELAAEVAKGEITLEEAQSKAALTIGSIRYGVDNKDYLWITDLHPVMVRHPYRSELEGHDLTDFTDAHGSKMFVEFVKKSRQTGEAYVDYMWQWMDDSTRIVPKISYVMEYKPWGWLIGTGVYLEDIKNEIAGMKRLFIIASLAIFALMTALLTIIVGRNLRVETQRSVAEQNLKESRERYRTLVEASTDGTLLFMDGKCIYANKKIKDLLAGTDTETLSNDLHQIIHPDRKDDIKQIREFQTNDNSLLQIETLLAFPDQEYRESLITISQVAFSDKNGFIYVIKDLARSGADETETAIKLLSPALSQAQTMGVFSANLRGKGRFTAFSPGLPALLGFSSAQSLRNISALDLIENISERKELISYLSRHNKLDGYRISIRKSEGGSIPVLVYAAVMHDDLTGTERISGIFVDYSAISLEWTARNEIVAWAAVFETILESSAGNFAMQPVFCSQEASPEEIAGLMTFYSVSVVFVQDAAGIPLGKISVTEILPLIRKHPEGRLIRASQIMNTSILTSFDDEPVSTIVEQMEREKAASMVLRDRSGKVSGVITTDSFATLLNTIFTLKPSPEPIPDSLSRLVERNRRLPADVRILLENGAKSITVNRLITRHSNQVNDILAKRVLAELGPPPVRFALIALGSEARKEQTLITDQDNALIYDDSAAGDATAESYFHRFGKKMNELLNTAGYEYCKGEIMAGNPKWNQPLKVWKRYFHSWISEANPQNILNISIFFDYRTIHGDDGLTKELQASIQNSLNSTPAFFGFMAMANLAYKIPINIFGRLQTESSEDTSGTINIKNASRVLVNIIRLYAIKTNLEETNTLLRIRHLYGKGVFPWQLYTDLDYSYEFLLQTQFRHQVQAFANRVVPDHNLNLSMLSSIEINTLKTIFTTISLLQNRLKHDFSVTV